MKKIIIRPVLFIVISFLIFLGLNTVLTVSNSYKEHAEMVFQGYDDLKDQSVDAVFIGNSHVFCYWQSAFAWKELGIASASLIASNMSYGVTKAVTMEALDSQAPELIVVEASMFNGSRESKSNVYLTTTSMKSTKHRLQAINDFCRYSDITGSDTLQYYIPFIQFHSRWDELNEGDFRQTLTSYLTSCYQPKFLKNTKEVARHCDYTDEISPVPENYETAFREYLDYCKGLDSKVLFYFAPFWGEKNIEKQKTNNYLKQILKEEGFDVLDYNEEEYYQLLKLDRKHDMMDNSHANINGSYKFTLAMGTYLQETYGLKDRSDDPDYQEWTRQADDYYALVSEYCTAIHS